MSRSTFIFGYGSLIERNSRIFTVPTANLAFPVIVHGVERAWNARTAVPGFSTTYLGATLKEGHLCNGVIFEASEVELEKIDKRERKYVRNKISLKNIEWLCDIRPKRIDHAWIYTIEEEFEPSMNYPIIQSYVDICMNGCIQIEEEFKPARKKNFLKLFLDNTKKWAPQWVNDRIQPRAPHKNTPNAIFIDEILSDKFPDLFSGIRIE